MIRIGLSTALATMLIMGASLTTGLAPASAADKDSHRIIHDDQIIANNSSPELSKKLLTAYKALGDNYVPRTEHWLEDGQPAFINRLILEDSPYLIQHAHNPVNWYPWGEEAFALAEKLDKPIFLSIGYATCHWCHVMERESFEDAFIASKINEGFIPIKVDREQRPDVDASYMTAVNIMNGTGGWPMSSWLNVEAQPFYAGTYYPPEVFSDLLDQITRVWYQGRESVEQQASDLADAVASSTRLSGEAREVGQDVIERAVNDIVSSFDDFEGGFGAAPKFPQESKLFLLLDHAKRYNNEEALNAAHFSLQAMAAGGIHDQVAGGFHRYAVDNAWLVPHFEKMLYNQALLSRNYLSAYTINGDIEHKRTVERVLDYVLREMTSPEGGFYSATDADSEGEEGTFFIWTPEELVTVLGKEDAALAQDIWNVTDVGNFEHKNILHYYGSLSDVSKEQQMSLDELIKKVDAMSDVLLQARQSREKPLRDEKIITAWNGMMITAFAEAGDILNKPNYIEAAETAANFIWANNRDKNGLLLRAWYAGKASVDSSQEDYAYLAESYITLYDLTGKKGWLTRAEALANTMQTKFWDEAEGGYFIGTETIGAIRPKDLYDTSIPTGNAVALRVLAKLHHRTGRDVFKQRAEALMIAFSSYLNTYPSAFAYLLTGASDLLEGEAGHRHYTARGNVKVNAWSENNELHVKLDMAPGWHVNANKPNQEFLIPTILFDNNNTAIPQTEYPPVVSKTLDFNGSSELALYENTVTIKAPLAANHDSAMGTYVLQLQACNETVCLAPEDVALTVSLAQ